METIEELQNKFYKLCDEQDSLNVTGFAEVFKELDKMEVEFTPQHPYTENEDNINKALELTGHSKDEAFCKAFKRNNQIIIEGEAIRKQIMDKVGGSTPKGIKLIMMHGCEVDNLSMYPTPKQIVPNDWNFYPIYTIAPSDLQDVVSNIIEKQATEGKGLWANFVEIPPEDESEDEFLMIDAFGLKCSLLPFLDDLKTFGIVGKGGLLNDTFKKVLLNVVKSEVIFVKDNTDKPARVKNHINSTLKQFDKLPVIGLIFQILTLQGLCRWLTGVEFESEAANGYKEAESLLAWLATSLIQYEVEFTCKPWGDADKQALQPLCKYLLSTDIGKKVQQGIFGEPHPQSPDTTNKGDVEAFTMPSELDTTKAKKKPTAQKQKGRKAKPLIDYFLKDTKQDDCNRIKALCDGRQGKDLALVILVAIKEGIMSKPTFRTIEKECNNVGSGSGFCSYMNKGLKVYTKEEFEGMKKLLSQ